MKRFATNPLAVLAVATIGVVASTVASVIVDDWVWFQRSGSLLTLAGAVLAARAIVRLGRKGTTPPSPFEMTTTTGSSYTEDGKLMVSIKRKPEAVAKERESRRDGNSIVLGFLVTLAGTVIWGYGDLFGLLF
jgi:hypothetical protein